MATIPIMKQGDVLIASMQEAVTDQGLLDFRDRLSEQIGRYRARAVIIDLTALDVVDSFATRTIRGVAHTARLRGARTIVVGIQPEVAFSMVQLGLSLNGVSTALDLEEALEMLGRNEGGDAR